MSAVGGPLSRECAEAASREEERVGGLEERRDYEGREKASAHGAVGLVGGA